MVKEGVDVEQAEVVMAVRSMSDELQTQIERLGRMVNEEIPAIADQMRAEMGASQASSFASSATQALNGQMESTRATKVELDQIVGGLTGEEVAGLEEPGSDLGDFDSEFGGEDEFGGDDIENIPANTGEEGDLLGRAEL